jgi:hypothetical protein
MKIKNLTLQLTEQHQEIERRYILRSYIKQTRDDILTAQGELELLKKTFIQEGQELEFIQALEKAAAVSGVSQNINLETVNQKELTLWEKEIPLRITISGPFPGVMSWLNEIEHLDYYVLFDQMTISTDRNTRTVQEQKNVGANFQGRVYWIAADAPYFSSLENLQIPEDPLPSAEE